MKKIKIAIVDDHPIIGHGISSFLKNISGVDVVFICQDSKNVIEKLDQTPVDILILDVVMPGISGLELFTEINFSHPSIKMIAYTSLNNMVLIKHLFRQKGVMGYLNKTNNLDELTVAINKVHEGEFYVPEQFRHLVPVNQDPHIQEISPREKEVLILIAQQYTSVQIAEKLFISVNTVESHRKKLFEKFEVENLAGLIKQAIEQGYLH